eukprot:CAMPEP_0113847456 /NCGR_PEP_ID=MMETSP0372-20130328/1882_1 /TAXON_ID=340204 /ORGANISM="Lankesteria abbotti" /LENGTH=262 /DNA_ID=CAMNT_0000816731 /DNA_START=75 /DNA_END=863 /DNA_ORIENTATION=+ /assembly_acc=CAM_ASM_000359
MFEARIQQGVMLRKIFESLKEMVNEVNLDCAEGGIAMQAMDSAHVALAMLSLNEAFFERFRCDRPRALGLNLPAVCKVFKLCNQDDSVIIRHADDSDTVTFVFEGAAEDRMSDFDLKLMNIESDHLGVPETKFDAVAELPSRHFSRICADLANFSDTVGIAVSSQDIKFSCKGSLGGGSTVLRPKEAENERIQLTVLTDMEMQFPVRYLNHFAKSSVFANQVRLSITPASPLEVTFFINDNSDLGSMKFFLAPKMDDDMDAN